MENNKQATLEVAGTPAQARVVGSGLGFDFSGMDTVALGKRYAHLSDCRLSGESRLRRHPSGQSEAEDVERDSCVREVLEAGLKAIWQEMATVMHELRIRPDEERALLYSVDETTAYEVAKARSYYTDAPALMKTELRTVAGRETIWETWVDADGRRSTQPKKVREVGLNGGNK